jgi:signal transduction histidine kinase
LSEVFYFYHNRLQTIHGGGGYTEASSEIAFCIDVSELTFFNSVSLKNEDQHDEGDGIYLGQCTINFEWGVCPGTIQCFTAIDSSFDVDSRYVKATRSYYVMNDMSALEGFKDRPYIKGWPYMKYYAEVPIHSPSGLTIGTLCVVDNSAREGLDVKGLATLQEVSEVIMNHLELCVSRIHCNNAEKMIQALGNFVEGKDSVRDWWMEAQASRVAEPGLQHLSLEKRADIELGSRKEVNMSIESVFGTPEPHLNQVLDGLKSRSRSRGYFEPALSSLARSSSSDAHPLSEGSSEVPRSPRTALTSPDPRPPRDEIQEPSITNQIPSQELSDLENVLGRATNLIREGISLDGIVIFDPRSSDGQLLTDFNISGEKLAWVDRRNSGISPAIKSVPLNSSSSYFPPFDKQTKQPEKYCKVLASSTRRNPNGESVTDAKLLVPEHILQMLLQRYPRGGILNYDRKGFIDTNDSTFLYPSKAPKVGGKPIAKSGNRVESDNSTEANKLRSILPEATAVLLLPLGDTSQDKWFAYSLAWTVNPARVFQRQDFTYLSSFGNSIMAELSRLEIIAADNAKSGFISSISHELRSPLHGIMASVELLRDVNTDPVSNTIISTVESCGSTLLDTIENLLTVTKVNRLSGRANRVVARHAPSVDLAVLVEDVTQMIIAGHYFRRTVEMSDESTQKLTDHKIVNGRGAPSLVVICDISPERDWVFKTDAGIWKRILMNLLGNSLKYTSSGFVLVKLRLEEDLGVLESKVRPKILASRARSMVDRDLPGILSSKAEKFPLERLSTTGTKYTKTFNVTLTIEDSGKGISQDYLTHHLFKPFYQEDTLSPGTGLGLSIVHQLVTSIGGSVHVTSELGSGTEVQIVVRLQRPDLTTNLPSQSKSPQFKGLRLGFCGVNFVPDLKDTPNGILDAVARRGLALRSTLADYAMNLGLSVLTVNSLDSDVADLILATEHEYQRGNSSRNSTFRKPLIVLSAEPTIRYGNTTTDFYPAFVLSQP